MTRPDPPTGRPAGFDAAALACRPGLLRYATKLTRDPLRAEDLVQDALLRAFAKHDGFEPGSNMQAWLTTILFNVFASGRRRVAREVEDPDGLAAAALASPPAQEDAVEVSAVRRRMRLMPKQLRDVLLLAMEGTPYEDMALRLGCEVGTVKSRLSRARAFLEGEEASPEPVPPPAEALPVALAIRALFAEGVSVSEIAARLGIPAAEAMQAVMALRLVRGGARGGPRGRPGDRAAA